MHLLSSSRPGQHRTSQGFVTRAAPTPPAGAERRRLYRLLLFYHSAGSKRIHTLGQRRHPTCTVLMGFVLMVCSLFALLLVHGTPRSSGSSAHVQLASRAAGCSASSLQPPNSLHDSACHFLNKLLACSDGSEDRCLASPRQLPTLREPSTHPTLHYPFFSPLCSICSYSRLG